MAATGFAVQCPHCFGWTDWLDEHPRSFLIDEATEWQEILAAVNDQRPAFSHPKLLTCANAGAQCPAPFRAFVAETRVRAHDMLKQIRLWGRKRAFRLWKPDHKGRWAQFSAVLFTGNAVPRLKHVELDSVFEPQLLSRSIHGISAEIKAPLTIYMAEVFRIRGEDTICWLPLEGYSTSEPDPVPERFNPACALLRRSIIKEVRRKLGETLTPAACPLGLGSGRKCGRRPAACLERDWNRCPAFLEERRAIDPCYRNDMDVIDRVSQTWAKKKTRDSWPLHRCWAGCTEFAVPIIIHDHLVAVAMSGQQMPAKAKPVDLETIVKHAPFLAADKDVADAYAPRTGDAAGNGPPPPPRWNLAPFLLTRNRKDEILRGIVDNVKRIQTAGNARYLHRRERHEMAFREELRGRLEMAVDADGDERNNVSAILERVREFWAFEAAYVLMWRPADRTLSLLARSVKGAPTEIHWEHPPLLGSIKAAFPQSQPLPWSRDYPGGRTPPNAWVTRFHAVCDAAASRPGFAMPRKCTSRFIAFPLRDKVWILALCKRDLDTVSVLRKAQSGGISQFAKECILDTTTEAVLRVDDFLQNRQHRQTLHSFILALTAALEMNDPYTAGHSQQVADLVKAMAREQGMSPQDQEAAWLAGMIHDIGKLVIDPVVLTKTGKLNYIQKVMMDEHPDIGFKILDKVGEMTELSQAVRQHHERYRKPERPSDVRGYPGLVEGEQINRFARLIAVADTYSAITTDRPYRPHRSPAQAIKIILDESGRQLHPDAVDAFMRVATKCPDLVPPEAPPAAPPPGVPAPAPADGKPAPPNPPDPRQPGA